MNTTVFVFYFLSSLLWKRIWTQNLLIDSKPADRPKSPTSFFIFNCLQHIKSYIWVFTKVYLHVALCIYIYIPLPVSIHRTSVFIFLWSYKCFASWFGSWWHAAGWNRFQIKFFYASYWFAYMALSSFLVGYQSLLSSTY